MSSYHAVEGRVSGRIGRAGLGKTEWLLALRCVTQRPITFFVENEEKMFGKQDAEYGTRKGEVYGGSDYKVRIIYFITELS